MKNAFNSILLLTLVGIAALACGALYFGAPLFGWIIMAAIFVVFLVEQFLDMASAKKILAESEQLDACENGRSSQVRGDGVVARRLELARHLVEKGIRIDSPIAYEVLSNSAGIALPRSSSGSVILLGLMGTFFGLAFKKYGHPVIAIVVGEFIIQLLFQGFVALGAPTTVQNIVTGIVLLAIVTMTIKPVKGAVVK